MTYTPPDPPDPVTVQVVDVNDTSWTGSGLTDGELPFANVVSITRTKNQVGECIIEFPRHAYTRDDVHVFADDSGTGDYHLIKVTRNGIVRFLGPAVVADGDSSSAGKITLHCRSFEWPLWQRYLDAQRTNELTNPSFETGDDTGWSAGVNLTTDEVTTADAIRGTHSERVGFTTDLTDGYKPQTVTITGTGIGTFVTVVGYFNIESVTGHALDRRGLYVEARESGVFKTNNYYAIDEATPIGHWIRAKTTIAVPPNTTWDLEIRLYGVNGTILWDDLQVVAMQSISTATLTGDTSTPVDVSDIVGLIHAFVQNPTFGKSDLNIGLDNPTIGVKEVKHIQWSDHISWPDQMAEWLERDDCFDYSVRNSTQELVLHTPVQGTDRRATVTLTFPGDITSFDFTEDGGSTITDDTELLTDTGDGPDREEGHFADATLVGGLTLQSVNSAPPKSEPSSLTPIARDKVNRARRPGMHFTLRLRGAALHSGTPWDELLGIWDAVTLDIACGWITTSGFGRIASITEYPRNRLLELTLDVAIPA